MASYNELNALIDAYINRNGVQAITGQILNGVLKAMVEQLGRGYAIMGAATPTTDPGTPDAPECWFASETGTYTDFDGLQVVPGELALLCYTPNDGWTKETIYEGFQTVGATIDGNVGTPSVGVAYANGVLSFDFHNMKGNTGDPAGFGTIGATVDGNIGTPGVTVQTSGPATAKNLTFAFTNLKGETGVTSVVATVDNTSGTPSCAVSLVGQQLTLAFTGLKGAQGDTGVSADYPIAIVNNLTTDDPASALSAAQGVVLEGEVSQLRQEVDELATGKFYGFRASAQDLPEGDIPGYAYVGTASPYAIYNFDGTAWADSGATVKQDGPKILHLEDIEGYDETLSPAEMQQFIQDAVDYAASQGMDLQFPKNKTFTIAIPAIPNDSLEKTTFAKQGGYGILVPSDITIDFNGSTLKVDTNDWWGYTVVHFNQNCQNSTVKNGIIVGDRATHIMSGVRGTDEWHYGISLRGAKGCSVENMEVCELRGDGINTVGFSEANTSVGTLKGTDFSSFSHSSGEFNAQSSLRAIQQYFFYNRADAQLCVIAPYSDHSTKDTTAYGCEYLVSYFDGNETQISEEIVLRGTPLTIPQGAVSFKLAIRCDNFSVFSSLSDVVFWVACYLPTERAKVNNCFIHDVGRNGGCINDCREVVFSDTKIQRVNTTNNFVGIDFESYTGDYTYDVLIENCEIDTEHPSSGGSISVGCGRNITVKNCKCKQGVYGAGYATQVLGTVSTSIELTVNTRETHKTSSGNIQLYQLSLIENCNAKTLLLSSGTVRGGNCWRPSLTAIQKDVIVDSRPIYIGCYFSFIADNVYNVLVPAIYYGCKMNCANRILSPLYGIASLYECDIVTKAFNIPGVAGVEPLELINCNIRFNKPGEQANRLLLRKMSGCRVVFGGGNVVYDAFLVHPSGDVVEITGNSFVVESGITIRYGLLSFASNTDITPTIIIRDNYFKTTVGSIVLKFKTSQQATYPIAGSLVLFSENTIDCVDAVKDFASGFADDVTVKRFNNRYISNSKLEDANIQDLWNPS